MGKRKDWFMGKCESPSDSYKNAKEWYLGKEKTVSTPIKNPNKQPKNPSGCPSCGATGLFFKADRICAFCGRVSCSKCDSDKYGRVAFRNSSFEYETTNFCSGQCYDDFWRNVYLFRLNDYVGTDIHNFDRNSLKAWDIAILNTITAHYKAKIKDSIDGNIDNSPVFPIEGDKKNQYCVQYTEFYQRAKIALADNLEKCGRIQDAAKIFEDLHMYDKSRELRQQDRHILVKNTNVSIDLNSLLKQVQDGGIVAVYRCPFCGGKLKVNQSTTLDSLRKCEHCNSDIKAMDLADFLKAVL